MGRTRKTFAIGGGLHVEGVGFAEATECPVCVVELTSQCFAGVIGENSDIRALACREGRD